LDSQFVPEAELLSTWVCDDGGKPVRLQELIRGSTPPSERKPRTSNWRPANEFTAELAAPALSAGSPIAIDVQSLGDHWPLLPFENTTELPGLDRTVPEEERRVLAANVRELCAYRRLKSEPEWTAKLDTPQMLTHARVDAAGILFAAGPRSVMALDFRTGAKLWQFDLPEPLPSLSLPQFSISNVLFRVGSRAVLALKRDSGQVAWIRSSAPSEHGAIHFLDGAPTYAPAWIVHENRVLLQTSTGERLRLDANSGTVLAREPTGLNPWASPPIPFENERWLVAESPLQIRLIREGNLRPLWVRQQDGEASTTGELPRMQMLGPSLYTATSRNYGIELERLQPGTGEPMWRKPRVLPAGTIRLEAAEANREHLVIPVENRLVALQSTDGREAWHRDMPFAAGWQVRLGRSAVIAFPSLAVNSEDSSILEARLARRFWEYPILPRALGLASTWVDSQVDCRLPILLIDRDSGTHLSRVDVPSLGTRVGVHLLGDTAAVASFGRICWLKSK
jgi:outer membrane protein assembly factor BamB